MGTRSSPGVKRPGHGVDHPPPSSAEVKERVELYLYSPSGPSWPFIGWTLLYLYKMAIKHCSVPSCSTQLSDSTCHPQNLYIIFWLSYWFLCRFILLSCLQEFCLHVISLLLSVYRWPSTTVVCQCLWLIGTCDAVVNGRIVNIGMGWQTHSGTYIQWQWTWNRNRK